jgi:hypothetical protein
MATVHVVVRGTDQDHHVSSPSLSEEEAKRQLAVIHAANGSDKPDVSWLSTTAKDIVLAEIWEDRQLPDSGEYFFG